MIKIDVDINPLVHQNYQQVIQEIVENSDSQVANLNKLYLRISNKRINILPHHFQELTILDLVVRWQRHP
jgi:hypothetical protein